MAILTYPLNGIQYNAEDAEAYLCTRESGVYSAENNFALEITDAMQVTIGKGIAWIKNEDFAGKVVKNDANISIAVPIADGVLNRIDRVVIQFNKAENASRIVLKQGMAASFPVAPLIVRDGIIYELGLYEIAVNAGMVEITNGNIKNTMLDETICGLMRDGVTGIPTATLQKQAEEAIAEILERLDNAVAGIIKPSDIGAQAEIKLATATLIANSWVERDSYFMQIVSVEVNENDKIDVQPDNTVINQMLNDGVVAIYFENENGVVTAYSVGAKPTADLTVQVTLSEVR